jgi:hypothetical protein
MNIMHCPECCAEMVSVGISGSGSIYYCPPCQKEWIISEVEEESEP